MPRARPDAESAARSRVVARSDVVVVGGGPAGFAAAIAARAQGRARSPWSSATPISAASPPAAWCWCWTTCATARRSPCAASAQEMIERMRASASLSIRRNPSAGTTRRRIRKWSRWGLFDFSTRYASRTRSAIAAAFDPDGWKRVSNEMVGRPASTCGCTRWFSKAHRRGWPHRRRDLSRPRPGRRGDHGRRGDRRHRRSRRRGAAGAKFTEGAYIVTTVFRLGGVDTDAAERFQFEEPEAFPRVDREAKRIIGGSWDYWWLKTPLPGIVWCNCPHMTGLDALKVEDLTRADFEGRKRIYALVDFIRANMPGFDNCYVIDVAPQLGVRQTRLLEGEYVVTKDDVDRPRSFPRHRGARPRLLHALSRHAAARDRGPAGGRPALLRDRAGAEIVARNSALHVDGPVGRRRGGAGAVGRTFRPAGRPDGDLRTGARPGRRSRRSSLRQCPSMETAA